jgi:cyclophilin family peptidyl-prolyl cis-trans isomerase
MLARVSSSLDSPAVPKATKRERQRQNRDLRRQAMLQAEQRRKRLRTARTVGLLLVPIAVILVVVAVTSGGSNESSTSSGVKNCATALPSKATTTDFKKAPPLTIDSNKKYTATLDTSEGPITIALDPKQAPQTVNSFIFLSCKSFYNGTPFHRIVTDFVDQGGDPKGDGTGGPGYSLPDEPPKNGYQAGDVAMANSGPNTSGSQFFLVVSDNGAKTLNGSGAPYKYSILGKMDAAGLEVAKTINTFGSSSEEGKPTKQVTLNGVTITTGTRPASTTSTTTPPPTSTTLAP